MALALVAPFSQPVRWVLSAGLLIYIVVVVGESVRLTWAGQLKLAPQLMMLIPTVHLAYGLGFLTAVARRMLGRRHDGDLSTRVTR